MFKKYFFLITIFFLIFSLSTAFAHPIPDSTSSHAGRRDLMLMGRAVHFSEHDVAETPRELSVTREERFYHRMTHRQRVGYSGGRGGNLG